MFAYLLLTPLGISAALRRLEHSEVVTPAGELPPSLGRFALEGLRVRDVLDRSRIHPEQSLSVASFARSWLLPVQHDYVVVSGGRLAGIVSLSMLRYLPSSEWEETPLERVLRADVPSARADDPVEDALQQMTENALTILPVTDGEAGFVGSISSHEIIEMVLTAVQGHRR